MVRRTLALALLVLLATGCAQPEKTKTVLRVSNWGGAGDDGEFEKMVQGFYREFEKENPGVEVRVEGIPGPGEYVPKMMLNFVAGTEPDVMTVDASSAAIFVNNGVLADLRPFIDEDPEVSEDDYFPNTLDIGRRGNAIYMLPGDFTPMVVYYNKDHFDQAGLAYPTAGWNFDDFRKTAIELTNREQGKYGFAFSNWAPGWVMWLWNNGGSFLSEDGSKAGGAMDAPQNVETLTFLRDLIVKDRAAPALSEMAAQGIDPFANGQAAMTVSGHWALVGYKNAPKGADGKPKVDWRRLGVVEMPHNTPKSHTVMYESGFGITRRSKHKDLAWKFVKMWSSYRLQNRYNASGIAVSARKDVAEERATEEIERQFLAIIPSARPPQGASVEGYEIVEKQAQNAMDSILKSGTPVDVALTRAASRIDAEFAKR